MLLTLSFQLYVQASKKTNAHVLVIPGRVTPTCSAILHMSPQRPPLMLWSYSSTRTVTPIPCNLFVVQYIRLAVRVFWRCPVGNFVKVRQRAYQTKVTWRCRHAAISHYDDVIMRAMASQITSLTIVYSTVYSGADEIKHQSSASLAFVRGIHQWPVNSPHKGPVTRQMFPFGDVIMNMTLPCLSVVLKTQLDLMLSVTALP